MKLHEDEKEKLILWRNLKLLLIRIFSVNLFTFIIKLRAKRMLIIQNFFGTNMNCTFDLFQETYIKIRLSEKNYEQLMHLL